MTQVEERGQRHGNPFIEVLARPGALRFSAAGFVGRMPMSMFGLGTVLLIASVTGQYGLAGIVAAAGSVGYAVVRAAGRPARRPVRAAPGAAPAGGVLRGQHAGADRLRAVARARCGR